MATSGSDQRKEKKPESVQFWLAIVAVSLLFHSLFIIGVKRWATVAVVEPAAGGAIDFEVVDKSDSKADSSGDPIVPASALKPEPFRPEPTPLPEFSPEPSSEPIVKPEEKPQVREEKKPIVPTPKTSPTSKVPKSTPGSPRSTPSPTVTPSTIPIPSPSPLTGGGSTTRSFESQTQELQLAAEPVDRPVDDFQLMPLPPIVLSRDFTNDVGRSIDVSVTFFVKCLKFQARVCQQSSLELSSSTPPPGLTQKYDSEFEKAVETWFEKLKVSSLTHKPDPSGTTAFVNNWQAQWTIKVTLQVKN